LWTLAAIYDVNLSQLLEFNDLSENSWIYPGDKIIIKPAVRATPTPTPVPVTVTPTATSLVRKSDPDDTNPENATPRVVKVRVAAQNEGESTLDAPLNPTQLQLDRQTFLLASVAALVVGLLIMLVSLRKS
jgi:hypothetical protein